MLDGTDILITGGTGTFGRELVYHLLAMPEGPRRIVIFSRDELKQHEMASHYAGAALERLRFFVGDVRDEKRLGHALRGIDYVVHAAAMKQVPACEYNPTEAIATNVGGAQALVNAAIEAGVERVIALSTDKAVNPVNLYGATKLCAEKLFTAANALAGALPTRFAAVRYGNVLGSRGSVLQVWKAQVAAGRKPSLTNPGMTRFWISPRQAVEFVLACLERMIGGEVFVPKLPSCAMVNLLEMAYPHMGWERIPPRQGEKMHETLIGPDEARYCWDRGSHYVLHPDTLRPHDEQDIEGWSYRSDTNPDELQPARFDEMMGRAALPNPDLGLR